MIISLIINAVFLITICVLLIKIKNLNYFNKKMYLDNDKLMNINKEIANEFKNLNTNFYNSKQTNELLLKELKELSDENENLQLEVDKLND